MLDELKADGLSDAFVVDGGAQRFAIALGAWRTEDAANAQQSALTKRGINGVKVGPRQQTVVQTTLIVRDPQTGAAARIKELSSAYPGSELRDRQLRQTGWLSAGLVASRSHAAA